jgi:hypothetical protein
MLYEDGITLGKKNFFQMYRPIADSCIFTTTHDPENAD